MSDQHVKINKNIFYKKIFLDNAIRHIKIIN